MVDAMEGGTEVFHYRVDILWWYIAHMKQPGSSAKRFQNQLFPQWKFSQNICKRTFKIAVGSVEELVVLCFCYVTFI